MVNDIIHDMMIQKTFTDDELYNTVDFLIKDKYKEVLSTFENLGLSKSVKFFILFGLIFIKRKQCIYVWCT